VFDHLVLSEAITVAPKPLTRRSAFQMQDARIGNGVQGSDSTQKAHVEPADPRRVHVSISSTPSTTAPV
jgi:hypothetical protein